LNLAGEKSLANNVIDVLIKPVPAMQLMQVVSNALGQVKH
jgi:hypothetical protein